MRILFISSNRVGDAVITTGLLDHLIRAHPESRITIVCGPAAESVFARMPNRERTILLDKRRYDLHWLSLWRQAVGTIWDLVIDLRGSALAFFLPARKRLIRRPLQGRMVEQLATLLKLDPPPLPVVWMNGEDHAAAARLLPPERPVIALGATANWPPKVWPAERFAALFRALASGPVSGAVPAVFSGPGPEEHAMAAPLIAALPGAIDLRGQLSLPEAAACIQRSTLFVGNDSGLMHVAAATGTPTIGLFGPTIDRAGEIAPAGRFAAWVAARGPAMTDLAVEDAVAAASRLLAEARGPESVLAGSDS